MDIKKGNNRGFSLIELLVALAIGAIIVAGIGSIMIVSSRSFNSTSSEAALQSSAQIVMDHIQDVVIDANQTIIYSYSLEDSPMSETDWVSCVNDASISVNAADITYKKLSVYNYDMNDSTRNRHYDITWVHNKSDEQKSLINYSEYIIDEKLDDTAEVVKDEKLADNIISFACDLTDIPKKRIFFVAMDFKKGLKEYHAANNISMRNKVALSVNTVSINASVSVDTIELNAEPGMDLPLAVRKVKTHGNASNKIEYQLRADSGKTSDQTEIIDKKTLHVDPKEQAPYIKVWAHPIDGTEDYDFMVYINRVHWTSDLGLGMGIDTTEGIVISGSPEASPDTVNIYSVTLNSNPGIGVDRTMPARVSANVVVTPATEQKHVNIYPSGSTAFQLSLSENILDNTKIKLRFTAQHSLADSTVGGGMSVRTLSYPDGHSSGSDTGVWKEMTVSVNNVTGPNWNSNAGFFRGMIGIVDFESMLNAPGVEEWKKKKFNDGQGTRYLLWRPYRQRPAVDAAGHNISYGNDAEGWGDPFFSDQFTTKTYLSEYPTWHQIQKGFNANFDGPEFNCLSPNYDTDVQYALVKCDNSGKIEATIGPLTKPIYGFRAQITKNGGSEGDMRSQLYLGVKYELDDEVPTWFNTPYMKVWQIQECFYDIANVKDAGFDMRMVLSKDLGSGGETVANLAANPSNGGNARQKGGMMVNMSRLINFPDNFWTNTLKSKCSVSDDPYYIWPKFDYQESNHGADKLDTGTKLDMNRPDAAMKFYVKKGNIKIDGKEAFVPYPKYVKDESEVDAHKNFFGKNIVNWSENYVSVGSHSIKNEDNVSKDYDCEMCYKDSTYWIKIYGAGIYRFNVSDERWEYKEAAQDKRRINLTTSNRAQWYVPCPTDEDFYAGYKSAENNRRIFITEMPLSQYWGGKWYGFGNTNKYKYNDYRFYIQRVRNGSNDEYYVHVDMPESGDIEVYKYQATNNGEWIFVRNEPDEPVINLQTDDNDMREWFVAPPGSEDFFEGFAIATKRPEFAKGMVIIDADNNYARYANNRNRTGFNFYCYKSGASYELHIIYPRGNDANASYTIHKFRYNGSKWASSGSYESCGTGNNITGGPNGIQLYVPGPDALNFYSGFDDVGETERECPSDMEIYRGNRRYSDSNDKVFYYNKDGDYYFVTKKRSSYPLNGYYCDTYKWTNTGWTYVSSHEEG